jgi:LmbE family N-acetylglucosaminyl deacetylase
VLDRILFVGAHHDDLELGLGGSVKRWSSEGKAVFAAFLTSSQWVSPDGQALRDAKTAQADCERAAAILGYQPFHLRLSGAMDLAPSDEHVVTLLNLIANVRIDTLITIWQYDAHPAHQATNAICMAASRKIPNVLTVRLSWNSVPQAWKPSLFVDISRTLEDRVKALQCYADEWARTGHLWEKYMRSTAALYGLEAGCDAAEGFEVVKARL